MFKKTIARVAVVTSAALGTVAANAAAVDVADLTADIVAQSAPVAAVGGAVLLVYVGIKAFRWVRAALS